MNLFAYDKLKQRDRIEAYINRKLTSETLYGRLAGFRLTGIYQINSPYLGKEIVTQSEETAVPGMVWEGLTEPELLQIDTHIRYASRERHKVLVLPDFPFVYKMYVIDAWVYVQPVISV